MDNSSSRPDVPHGWNGRGDIRGSLERPELGPPDVLRLSYDGSGRPGRNVVRAFAYRAATAGAVAGAAASLVAIAVIQVLGG